MRLSATAAVVVASLAAALIVGRSPVSGAATSSARVAAVSASNAPVTPIRHVVVIFQENHSFDNVLGSLCVADGLDCDGATTGKVHWGGRIPLAVSTDVV